MSNRLPFHRRPLVSFLAALVWLAATSAHAAEPWARWRAHDPASTATVDHSAWTRLLRAYLHPDSAGVNRFDYGAVRATDRAALDDYLRELTVTSVSHLNRNEQFAFWINLYNALTVRVVLDHYPVSSIRDIDISPGGFSDGPWGKKLIAVDGVELSLDDIEHRIVRPIWADPRIHYALNCASIGCPQLGHEAYVGARIDRMLDDAARAFVNHPRGVRLSRRGLVLSRLYDWYAEDFGGSDKAVIAHLIRFADPPLAAALGRATRISGYQYDWRLNGAE